MKRQIATLLVYILFLLQIHCYAAPGGQTSASIQSRSADVQKAIAIKHIEYSAFWAGVGLLVLVGARYMPVLKESNYYHAAIPLTITGYNGFQCISSLINLLKAQSDSSPIE